MENQDRFSTFDRALLAICLIVVFLCAFLMIDGRFLFSGDDTSKLSAVGKLESSENDVRQKHQTGFTWRGSRHADVVYEGDSIFTGTGSKATIKFSGGGELQIDPKSLVVIRTNNGKLELNLMYGAFSGDLGNEKIVVIRDGERTELTGKVDDKTLKKPIKLTKNISLMSPNNNSPYWSGDIKYSWNGGGDENSNYIVEFSNGPSFKKKIAEVEVSGTELSSVPQFLIPPKTNKKEFFWRVRSKENRTSISEVRKVTMYKNIAPLLTLPSQKYIFLIEPEKEETKTATFGWIDASASQNYTIQIAKDEGFNNLVATQTLEKQSFKISSLEQGEYFWRVQGNHPTRSNSPWSAARSFTVVEKVNVAAPQVASSEKVYVLPLAKVLKLPANYKYEELGVPVTDYPIYKWSSVMGVSNYALEVSKDKQFTNFATETISPPKTDFRFMVMKPGIMNWRVRSVMTNGEKTEPSSVSVVRTDLPPPPTKKPDVKKDGIVTSWAPLLFARHYEVQWASDDQFTSATSAITNSATYKVVPNVPVTVSLFWRVRALDQYKRPLSAFTNVEPLRIVRKLAGDFGANEELNRPVPREPRAQTSVISFDDAPVFLNFKWSRVRQVTNYRFELSQNPQFTDEPIVSSVVNGNQILVNQKLPPGEFFWRVRGENEDGSWTVWSDPASFFIQFK